MVKVVGVEIVGVLALSSSPSVEKVLVTQLKNIRKREKKTHLLHGSKISRESDLRTVPYIRPVGVRSFVKNVKYLKST